MPDAEESSVPRSGTDPQVEMMSSVSSAPPSSPPASGASLQPSPVARALPWIVLVARLVVGGVWIGAGLAKITEIDASVRAVRAYQLLPEAIVPALGAALPAVEVLVGVLLVVGAFVRVTAVVSAVLLVAFVVGIASAWARGLRIDCGCFGSGGALAEGEDPTYGWEIARDVGLIVLAAIAAWRPSGALAVDSLLRRPAIEES